MQKLFTVELNQEDEVIELHLNKAGAEYLKKILEELISDNKDDHLHLMSADWGGNELSADKQNLSDGIKLLHQLKIMYWKE